MTLKEFIRKYQKSIDDIIKDKCPNCDIDDRERRLWVQNDEFLYKWARSEGVNRI